MKSILILIAMAISTNVFAAPASSYTCVGKNAVNDEAVSFELLFADHAPEAGYTNQSITITKSGLDSLATPVVLQMFEASEDNNCKVNELGETYLYDSNWEMTPLEDEKGILGFKVNFKSSCDADHDFDVKAVCILTY
jgi:hypothetical protein